MSAEAERRFGGARVARAAFSLALIALAGGVLVKGIAFARLGAVEWGIERHAASPPAPDAAARAEDAALLRAAVAPFLDEGGLRDKARLLSFSAGRRLAPPAANGVQEIAAALAVDPVAPAAWMDLAELTWPDLALRPTSMAAWELSRLTGPYEYAEMMRRARFLAQRWMFASPESKRALAYDIAFLRRFPDPFLRSWQQLLAPLPAAQRRAFLDEVGAAP